MKKIVLKGFLLLTFTALLAACSTNETTTESGQSQESSQAVKTEVEITDSNGSLTVPYQPKKVVVFDFSTLDTLRVLGVSDTVVAAPVESLPDYLDTFDALESAGGIKEPDLEKINQLQPDLIIISGRQQDFQADLEKIAPTMFLTVDTTNTWESIQHNVTTIGEIFGKEKEAQEELANLATMIDETKEKAEASNLKALTLLINEGSLSSYGAGSRFSILHDTFGFAQADENIEASTHGQSVSYEYVLKNNPDLIFVIDRTKAIGGDTSQNSLVENELVQQTTAGENDQVVSLDPQVWYLAGSGIESLKLMIEDVNQAFK